MKMKFSIPAVLVLLSISIYSCKKEPTKLEDIKIKSVEASSSLESNKNKDYAPENLVDWSRRSWCEGKDGDGAGETIKIVFEKKVVIGGFFIRNGYGDFEYFKMNGRVKDIEVKATDGTTVTASLKDDYLVEEVKFNKLIETGELLIKINSAYSGSKWKDTCLTEIAFDKKKIDTIIGIPDACRKEGKSYEFGACIPAESPIAAIIRKISPIGLFSSDINTIPDFCGKRISLGIDKGTFFCGGPPPGTGEGSFPAAAGKCKKLSPNEIECTVNKCSNCEFDSAVLRIKKHELYDNVMEIYHGPYSWWLEKSKEFQH